MNTIKVKINPYKDTNIVSVDDMPLSPYSALSNYLHEPFLKWADKFLQIIEDEVNDDFHLHVVAERFETMFLQDIQNSYSACIAYETSSYPIAYSVDERLDMVQRLARKYAVSADREAHRIPIWTSLAVTPDPGYFRSADMGSAFLYITETPSDVRSISMYGGPMIILLLSDENSVSAVGDMKYVWQIRHDRLESVMDCLRDRFAKVPYLMETIGMLTSAGQNMEPGDQETLVLASEVDMFISAGDIAPMEVQQSAEIKLSVIPADSSLPPLRILSVNPDIVCANGTVLTAIAAGSTFIEIYRANEIVPVIRKKVTVQRNHFVQQISLQTETSVLGVGMERRISVSVFPEDADDAQQIRWESSDPSIADVHDGAVIRTTGAGKVRLTAHGMRATASLELEVLPDISKIVIDVDDNELYVGQVRPITVSVIPKNAYDGSYMWKTSDANVAVVEKTPDGTEILKSTGIGDCVITCRAVSGDCSVSRQILVESTFKKRENIHNFLSITAVFAAVTFLLAVCSLSVLAVIGAVLTICFGIKAFTSNASDRVWAILLIIASVVIAVLGFM